MYVCYDPRVVLQNGLLAIGIVIIILFMFHCGKQAFGNKKSVEEDEGYLDYMPTAIEPCPSHYRCGAASVDQVRLENDLFNNLRESEKYTSEELMQQDQCCVLARDSEPTSCMMERAAEAKEGALPEGVRDVREDIEAGMIDQGNKRI